MTIAWVEYCGNGAFSMHFRTDLATSQLEDIGACILATLRQKGVDIARMLALADVGVHCAEEYATREYIDTLAPSVN